MIECRHRMPFAAIQWTGKDSEHEEAVNALAPRFNILRYTDRLRGSVLRVMDGAWAATVPRGYWLIWSTRAAGEPPFVLSDKDFRRQMEAWNEPEYRHNDCAERPMPWQ